LVCTDIFCYYYYNKPQGPFTIDILASNLYAKLPKCYSKYWCTGAAGVDVCAYSWHDEKYWLVPPPELILKAVMHIKKPQATSIMVIPKWRSSYFLPEICNNPVWMTGITVINKYCKPKNFFHKGPYGNNVFSNQQFASNVLVLKIDFTQKW
jgi:hypothetical protein